MTVCFLSNYLTHHQVPFCLAMDKLTDGHFVFIETEPLPAERKQLGYATLGEQYDFVIAAYQGAEQAAAALHAAIDADVTIIGSAPDSYIRERLKQNKLTFRYSERLFKRGYTDPLRQLKHGLKNAPYRNSPLYYLFSSAYAAHDYQRCGARPCRMFQWGYFPHTERVENVATLMDAKKPLSLLWAGRYLNWKHPEAAVDTARYLKEKGYTFTLDLIGSGEEEPRIREQIRHYGLEDYVHLLGTMSPDNVRKEMKKHTIFLFTSDYNEGWGAVVNEAMNSGCAVVASHAAGCVPFLLRHGDNGYIYKSGNTESLFRYTATLCDDAALCRRLGQRAYETIVNKWNGEEAARRLIALCGDDTLTPFSDGILSAAQPIPEDNMYSTICEE